MLARRLGGERALPSENGLVLVSPERLCRHVLVCGATGSGKTESLLRLAWTIAKTSSAPVFYLDGKGDRQTAMRFCALMTDADRHARVFPNEPFDGWRGQAHEIHGRLMEIIDYASEGPASWYRDLAKNVLRLVCEHPDGPPRCSTQTLERIDAGVLAQAHPKSRVLAALSNDHVRQVRLRYEAFFGQTRGALDGTWAWEDTNAAYLLLDSLTLREETNGLARFLFEDFAHYFTTRKPHGLFCVLIVDEFSSLAQGTSMASRVEQARGFRTSLILAPQVVAGIGSREQTDRILGSVESVICHRMNTPEEIVALAGTRQQPEYSIHYGPEGPTGEGSARVQHQFKIDPNKIRSLRPGEAYIISRGRAMRAQMLTAPDIVRPLPQPQAPPPAGEHSRQASGQTDPRTPDHKPSGEAKTTQAPPAARIVPFEEGSSDKGIGELPF